MSLWCWGNMRWVKPLQLALLVQLVVLGVGVVCIVVFVVGLLFFVVSLLSGFIWVCVGG